MSTLDTILETLYLLEPDIPRSAMTNIMLALEDARNLGIEEGSEDYVDLVESMKEAME